jgi:hypothetical protein
MRIVMAGNPSHVRQVVGLLVLAACGMTGCAAHSGPRPMVAEAPPPSSSSVVTETPVTTQPQTAPTTSTEITSADTQATTLPSREAGAAEATGNNNRRTPTSNGGEMLPPGRVIQVEGPPHASVDYSVSGTYLYGSVRGYSQVPAGGALGTSNANRPQFHSIGLNTANIADVEVSGDAHQYGDFFVGAQIIQLSGTAYIGNKTLTTDGITYPANSRVNSDIGLNWYRFGYRYTIPIDTAQNGVPDITFTPFAEGLIWDFNYNLTVARNRSAQRAFAQGGAQIGASFAWRPNGGPLSLEATLGGFPQASHLANISVESLDFRYSFYEYQRFNFSGLLGVTWEQQDFRDTQKLPNHISVDFGPMLTAGLKVQF